MPFAWTTSPRCSDASLEQKAGDISGEGITRDNLAIIFRDLARIPEAIRSFRDASACHLRSSPPDIDKALRSLTLALLQAIHAGQTEEANEVSAQLDNIDQDELRKLLRHARIAGQSKSASAIALYQRIAAKTSTLPPTPQAQLRAISQAGLLRAQYRTTWPVISSTQSEGSAHGNVVSTVVV